MATCRGLRSGHLGFAGLTTHDAAAQAGLKHQSLTPDQAYDAMRNAGLDESLVSMGAEYAAVYTTGWGDYTTTDFADIMGRQPRSFTEFASEFL